MLGVTYPYTSPVADILLAVLGCSVLLATFSLRYLALGWIFFFLSHVFAQWGLGYLLGELLWTRAELFSRGLFVCALIAAAWSALLPGRYVWPMLGLVAVSGTLAGTLAVSALEDILTQVLMMGSAAAGALAGLMALSGAGCALLHFIRADWAAIGWRVLGGWVTAVAGVMLTLNLY